MTKHDRYTSFVYWLTIFFMLITFTPQSHGQSTSFVKVDTWCIGRYLIDLPKGTKVEAEFMTKGSKVFTSTGISMIQFRDTVAARRQTLKETRHHNGGVMLVDTDIITDDYITLVSWASEASKRMYKYETFQYMEEHQVLYLFSGLGTAGENQRKSAAAIQRSSRNELRYRAPTEVPSECGFCINEGLILTSSPNREEYTAVMRLPQYPDVVLELESYVTNNPGDSSNQQKTPLSLKIGNYFQIKTLRNRKRDIGEAKGKEHLTRSRYKENGKYHYQFEWKTQGIKGSINYPYMRFTLRTMDGSEENYFFSSDKDVLELWESILNSLRLRTRA